MEQYILAHDLGTSGNKATLYSLDGKLIASTLYEYPTYHPGHHYVEQSPDDWWKAVCITTNQLLEKAKVENGQIGCVCFSAHMMGCLLVDREGKPLRNMLIWADTRSTKQAQRVEQAIPMSQNYDPTDPIV